VIASREVPAFPRPVVLDACVLLNLYATGHIAAIIDSFPGHALVSTQVLNEVLHPYNTPKREHTSAGRASIQLEPLIVAGALDVISLDSEREHSVFVTLARHLGDGEAASGALALTRSAPVATDDRKAIRVFAEYVPPIPTVGTVQLLQAWETRANVERTAMRIALCSVRLQARFEPANGTEGKRWWCDRTGDLPV